MCPLGIEDAAGLPGRAICGVTGAPKCPDRRLRLEETVSSEAKIISDKDVPAWAESVDVLVIGHGMSGTSAAIAAREAGRDVLILERAGHWSTSSSALSGGQVYLGGGTPVQLANGFEDKPDDLYNYLMAVTPDPDPVKVRLYADGSVAHFHWLEANGVPFTRGYWGTDKHPLHPGKDCLSWSGNETVWPIREKARPFPRGHKPAVEDHAGGLASMTGLSASAEKKGVRTIYEARVTALVREGDADGTGRIVGARVKKEGEILYYRGTMGVVLAAGGFIMNEQMCEQYLPQLPKYLERHGNANDDGFGIQLGMAAGAGTAHMNDFFTTACFYPPSKLVKGIIVNKFGRRFVQEDSYHGRTAALTLEQPDGIGYLILDSEIFDYPEYKHMGHTLVDGWETIAEMEAGLGVPKGSLEKTLGDYNAHAANGEDPEFHKEKKYLKPLTAAPYAAFNLSKEAVMYTCFTLGGLTTNENAQVLDTKGRVIPGLYAVGANASNLSQNAEGYVTGISWGQGTFFGRRAGKHAAGG